MPINHNVDQILSRAFGGAAAVVVPGMIDQDPGALQDPGAAIAIPDAPAPAGVVEAIAALDAAIRSADGPATWLFLIGGPGNGKSHQISKVLNSLGVKMTAAPGGLARRSEKFVVGGKKLLVVNDATIRERRNASAGPLAEEINDLIESPHVSYSGSIVGVNRGILVEELARLNGNSDWHTAAEVLQWLSEPSSLSGALRLANGGTPHDYHHVADLCLPGEQRPRARIHAVFLDQLSLLELAPGVTGYRVMKLDSPDRLNTPAGILLEELVSEARFERSVCSECMARDWCPMLANARDLRQPEVRRGLLALIRAAEVTSGQLMTYRDLWSIYATAIAGRSSAGREKHACEWVCQADREDVPELWELAQARWYESLFPEFVRLQDLMEDGEDEGNRTTVEGTAPALDRLALVDPSLDTRRSWAKKVADAVEAIYYAESPIERLAESDPLIQLVVGGLDRLIAKKIIGPLSAAAESISDLTRRRRLRWRARSMFRLYGVCHGWPANRDVIEEWIAVRQHASSNETRLPPNTALHRALQYLFLPPSKRLAGVCQLPVFRPRVDPVIGNEDSAVWCYSVATQNLGWTTFARGDDLKARLWYQIAGKSTAITDIELDFTLCREALTMTVLGATPVSCEFGFTDRGWAVSPRLERVRASFLTDKEPDVYSEVAIDGAMQHTVSIQ